MKMQPDIVYHGWLDDEYKASIAHNPDTASRPYATLKLADGSITVFLTPLQVVELHDLLSVYIDARAAEAEAATVSAQAAAEANEHAAATQEA